MINIFDIETGPLPTDEIQALLPPFNPDDVAIGNRKDPAKIEEYIEEKRKAYESDAVERAALSPFYGRILAIGMVGTDNAISVIDDDQGEADLLESFFGYFRSSEQRHPIWAGWNCFKFDIPFIRKRAMKLGITPPHQFVTVRYPHDCWRDLMIEFNDGNRHEYTGLDRVARWLGVGAKTGNGADFHTIWYSDRKIGNDYLKNDLELTSKVAARMGVQ